MFLTFLIALFWASAALYIIGLAMGIFTFKHSETHIVYNEKLEEIESESQGQSQQLDSQYEEINRVNMNGMF